MDSASVFISYSHKDEDWKDRLVTHLGVLQLEKKLDLWEDRRIDAGDDWQPAIEMAINKATVAILMISANFLTSKFILSEEVPKLLERRASQGIRVIPIIVKPCVWTRVKWLSKLQARPKDGRALSSGNENQIDADLALIADELARLVERDGDIVAEINSAQHNIDQPGVTSSNLHQDTVNRLGQRITELIKFGDYEKAIRECGDFLDHDPHSSLINLLIVIATLKGRGANRYQTRTVKRLEKHLSHACDDSGYYPTALVIWGLIKHDHYKLNALHQEKPTLNDIKEALTKVDLEQINLDLVEKIKASQQAYEYLNLLRFFHR